MSTQRLVFPMLLLLTSPALGQPAPRADPTAEVLPKPTEAGLADLKRLVARCVEGGALKFLPRTQAGPSRLVLSNRAALDRILREDPKAITPALRDTLLTTSQTLDQSVLLEAVAELDGDGRLRAHAALARAESLEREGNAPAASRRYEEAVQRFAALGHRHRQASALSAWAGLLAAQGQSDDARKLYVEAVALVEAAEGKDSRDAAIARVNLGGFEEQCGRPEVALEEFRRAAEILERLPDPDAGALISAHQSLGGVLLDRGEHESALAEFRRALEWAGRLPEGRERAAGEARALANLALAEQRSGRLDDARPRYERSIALLEGLAGGKPHPMLAEVLDLLGTLHLARGDRAACLANLERAQRMRIALDGDRAWGVARGHLQVGAARKHFGDYAGARDAFREATRVAELLGGPAHPSVAEGLAAQAEVAIDQGNARDAIELTLRERSILEPRQKADPAALAACRNRLGRAYHQVREDDAAVADFRGAAELWRLAGPSHAGSLASATQNLGSALSGLGRYDEALDVLNRAVAIRERITPRDDAEIASGLNALGSLLYARGDYAGALRSHGRAWDILKGRPSTTADLAAGTLHNLGMVYFGLRQWREAATRIDEALDALRARPPEAKPDPESAQALYGFAPEDLLPIRLTATVLQLRGMVRLRMASDPPTSRDLFDAAFCFLSALSLLERIKANDVRDAEGRWEIARDLGNLDALLIGCYARLRDRPNLSAREKADSDELIVKAADLGAARSLLIELAEDRADVLGDLPPAVRDRRREILGELSTVESALAGVQGPSGLNRDFTAVEALMERRARAARALKAWRDEVARDHPEFAGWERPRPSSPAEVREVLGADEVALIYIMGNAESYLIAIGGGSGPSPGGLDVVRLPRSGEIAELTAAAIAPARLASGRAAPAWREAYRTLIGPVADRIRGKDLVIVPTGPLCHLPFGLLARDDPSGPRRGRFLVQDHAIRYALSPGVLRLLRRWNARRDHPDRVLWGMGDPIYAPDDPRRPAGLAAGRGGAPDPGMPALERLTDSGRELLAIREALVDPSATILTGSDATEEAVKSASRTGALGRTRFVHFAVHGLLGPDGGRRPSLALGLGGIGREDGRLDLDEVARLRLNADLVVLSACESGLGRLHEGEGVRGLPQAFLRAGSRGVACSLWRVADAPTATLMAEFYTHLKAGRPAAKALRLAQIAHIEAGEPPLFWAPFILIGE